MGTLIGSLMILRNDWHFIYDNGIIIFLSAFRLEIRSISKKFRDLSHIKWYVRLAFRSNEDLDICWQLLKLSDKHMKIHYSALYICTYLEFSIKRRSWGTLYTLSFSYWSWSEKRRRKLRADCEPEKSWKTPPAPRCKGRQDKVDTRIWGCSTGLRTGTWESSPPDNAHESFTTRS